MAVAVAAALGGNQRRSRGTLLVWAYFDSTALVKLNVQESGRPEVLRLLRQMRSSPPPYCRLKFAGRYAGGRRKTLSKTPVSPRRGSRWLPIECNGISSLYERKFWIVPNRLSPVTLSGRWTQSTSRQRRSLRHDCERRFRSSALTAGRLRPLRQRGCSSGWWTKTSGAPGETRTHDP